MPNQDFTIIVFDVETTGTKKDYLHWLVVGDGRFSTALPEQFAGPADAVASFRGRTAIVRSVVAPPSAASHGVEIETRFSGADVQPEHRDGGPIVVTERPSHHTPAAARGTRPGRLLALGVDSGARARAEGLPGLRHAEREAREIDVDLGIKRVVDDIAPAGR